MTTIWKFPLQVVDQQLVNMPVGTELLHVGVQGDQACLWALVDSDAPRTMRGFAIHGTGHAVPPGGAYVGTFPLHGGNLIFHVFDLGENPS